MFHEKKVLFKAGTSSKGSAFSLETARIRLQHLLLNSNTFIVNWQIGLKMIFYDPTFEPDLNLIDPKIKKLFTDVSFV